MKWRDQKPNYKPMKSIQIHRPRRASNEGQKNSKNSKKSKKQSKFKIKPNKKTSCFVLLAVYVIYLVLGAVVFQALEHPNEVGCWIPEGWIFVKSEKMRAQNSD